MFIETYLDNAIAHSLKLKALCWHPWSEALSSLFAIVIIVLQVIFPVVNWILLVKFKLRLNEEALKHRFGAAYENIRTSSTNALGYTSIFMIKRLAFTLFVFLIEDQRTLQQMLIIWMLVFDTAYTWNAKPFTDNLANFQEVLNDYMVLTISYSLIIFGDFVPDKKAQYQIGWVVCVLIGLQIASNIGIIIFKTIHTFVKKCKLRKIKKQRERERVEKQL